MLKRICKSGVLLIILHLGLHSVAGSADMLAIGDSMMQSVGRSLRRQGRSNDLQVEVFTSIGSGLARLDLLDWHAKATELVQKYQPDTVFVMMGANDNQAMQSAGRVISFGSDGWIEEYGRRAGRFIDLLLQNGVSRVVWVGLPIMREERLEADVRSMERMIVRQIDARDKAFFYSVTSLFASPNGYRAYIIQPNGMPLDVRSADGIHLNRNGAEILAEQLLEKFRK